MDKIRLICKAHYCRRRSCPYNVATNINNHEPGDLLLPVDFEGKDECQKKEGRNYAPRGPKQAD